MMHLASVLNQDSWGWERELKILFQLLSTTLQAYMPLVVPMGLDPRLLDSK